MERRFTTVGQKYVARIAESWVLTGLLCDNREPWQEFTVQFMEVWIPVILHILTNLPTTDIQHEHYERNLCKGIKCELMHIFF